MAAWLAIWQAARQVHPEASWRSVAKRLRFGLKAWWHRRDWAPLRSAPPGSLLGQVVRARQGRMHLVAWAYVHRDWSVRQRVQAVHAHYEFVERHAWLRLPLEGRQVVCRLDDSCPGLSLQFERPDWIENEGELALSLFLGDKRLYMISFLFGPLRGGPALIIGAIQGRNEAGVNAAYAQLTRQLHGCRPRDLLVHAVLFVGEALSLPRAYGISDGSRHHRAGRWHFADGTPTCDYDEVWIDRGGVPGDDGFLAIDTAFHPRQLAEVPAKKRAMYRRRYEMLGRVRDEVFALARADQEPRSLLHDPAT